MILHGSLKELTYFDLIYLRHNGTTAACNNVARYYLTHPVNISSGRIKPEYLQKNPNEVRYSDFSLIKHFPLTLDVT